MSGHPAHITSHLGDIERFGMRAAIGDEIEGNFKIRGYDLGRLLAATLTETPYAPTIDGRQYSIPVSNVYGTGSVDTVHEARDAIAEAIAAKAPGMGGGNLIDTLKTRYDDLASNLLPNRKDGERNNSVFEEAFMASAREHAVSIPNPKTGYEIIADAPKRLAGLVLSKKIPNWNDTYSEKMVTTDGRVLQITLEKRYPKTATPKLYMPTEVSDRGGFAPGSTIVSQIKNRVVSLRSEATRR